MSYNEKCTSENAKTILVVEDDDDLGDLIMQVLDLEGEYGKTHYHAMLATDSMKALQMVQTEKPDLFLLDYYLPRMTGLELYDRLHATEGLEHIPAIFISANPPRQEIEKRHLVSMKKPFNLKDLLHTIENMLSSSSSTQSA